MTRQSKFKKGFDSFKPEFRLILPWTFLKMVRKSDIIPENMSKIFENRKFLNDKLQNFA